jgi:hypothetical protein
MPLIGAVVHALEALDLGVACSFVGAVVHTPSFVCIHAKHFEVHDRLTS